MEEYRAKQAAKFQGKGESSTMKQTSSYFNKKKSSNVRSSDSDSGDSSDKKNSKTPQSLDEVQEHLKCPVCTEIFYKPTTLPCGHAFCRHCLLQVANHTVLVGTESCKCPTCRNTFALRVSSFEISISLWNVISSLYPQMCDDRKADAEYIYSSESAKLVSKEHVPPQNIIKPGEYVFDNLRDSRKLWRTVDVPENDSHMRRILGLLRFPRSVVGEILHVGIATLILEEDEVIADEGFPIMVAGDDINFIDCTNKCGPFTFLIFPLNELNSSENKSSSGGGIGEVGGGNGDHACNNPPVFKGDGISLSETSALKAGKAQVEFDISGLQDGFWHLHVYNESKMFTLDLTFRKGVDGEEDSDIEDSEDDSGRATYTGNGFVMVSEDSEEDSEEEEYDDQDGFIVNDDEPLEVDSDSDGLSELSEYKDDDDEEEEEEEEEDEDESSEIIIQSGRRSNSSDGDGTGRPKKRRKRTIIISDSDDD